MATTTPPPSAYRDPVVGDLVLRTSDQVDFHVHQRRLADVSHVFADMLSFPHPPSADNAVPTKPVVDVAEKSELWGKLLPLFCNDEEPRLSLADISSVLQACRKYQASGVSSRMRAQLFIPPFLDEKPFTVYALACFGGFEDVAEAAAKRTLRLPACPEDVAEYSLISGRAVYRLIEYRKHCGEAASAVICLAPGGNLTSRSSWLPDYINSYASAVSCPCGYGLSIYPQFGHSVRVRQCWVDFLNQLEEAVRATPCGEVVFSPSSLKPVLLASKNGCGCEWKLDTQGVKFLSQVKTKIDESISEVLVFEA
ncbi:hypothetical protein FKP32DRAFT_1671103 [Trametes sanguinea]|nr:hypothetical protein FKP32DRAFT_1671103 [Trametes sanguinea]